MGLNIASNENAERIARALETIAQKQAEPESGEFNPAAVQLLIRHGQGAASYPVGSSFQVTHTTYGTHKFNVIGHDHDQDARGLMQHTMTLHMDDQLGDATPFDAQEALYCASEGMNAGPYNFTLPAGYDEAYGGGKTYCFTLANSVPAGGQLVFEWGYQKQAAGSKIKVYAGPKSTETLETASVAEGANGTSLGTADARGEAMNHIHCARYGYGRWSQSAIRQWLNSSAAAGAWWEPQSVFDRIPSYANRPGYLAGFDAAFVAALGEITHATVLNAVTDGGTSETVTDKVFLLSRKEVGLGNEIANQNDGSVYEYWDGATNKDHIKLRGLSAASWWLRTPHSGYAYFVRIVGTGGSLSSSSAYNAYGVVPACVIM